MENIILHVIDTDFNPRSREGSDRVIAWLAGEQWVFQSTLPRGERLLDPNTIACPD